ncbi:MAG: polysaccharide pyruvyl transferase family protein [Cetobacterium sp.]
MLYRLQMYATQKIYEELGYGSEILRINFENYFKSFIKKNINLLINRELEELKRRKIKRFKEHTHRHIIESNMKVYSYFLNKNIEKKYDFFSVGSDQIWSQDVSKYKNKNTIFLRFTTKDKRITFSPSFGHSNINIEHVKDLKIMLEEIPYISIREEEGKSIINRMLPSKKVEVLLDPTMNISKETWIEFTERHKYKPSKKYILTYFLGEPSKKVVQILEKYQKEYEIVRLNDLNSKEYYDINPSEWVDYINSATLFLTDSFHGVAFSLILGTPFSVYDRVGGKSMNSRIKTILNKFNMQNHYELDKDNDLLFNKLVDIKLILENEKIKTFKFLKKSLGENE